MDEDGSVGDEDGLHVVGAEVGCRERRHWNLCFLV